MKLGFVVTLASFLLLTSNEGFKLPKSSKLEQVLPLSRRALVTSRLMSPNAVVQTCLTAISTGSSDMLTPLCRVWALEFIKNRIHNEEAVSEEMQQSRNLQDLISFAKAYRRIQDVENSKIPSRPDGAYFYSPATNKWERIRF